jgi:HTH-type transcriptional regulator, sugar sensing transcriptional regulator
VSRNATNGFVDRLGRLGLTSYEAKVYLALIRRGSASAPQVARIADLPRQRIYDVLASLVEKGLASSRHGKVVEYAATPPNQAIERLIADHRELLAELEQAGTEMAAKLAPAFSEGQGQTDPLEYIEILRDRRAINERFNELQAGVEKEILVFTKPPYATPPQENVTGLEVSREHEARSVYELSVFEDEQAAEGVRRFIEAGEEARFCPELPLKLVIIDERIVMFGMEDPVAESDGSTILVVEHPALARILKIAFDAVWSDGLTFEQAQRRVAKTKPSARKAERV